MITKNNFINYINEYQNFLDNVDKISEAITGLRYNLFEAAWISSVDKMFDEFLKSHFNESGCDLVYWWMFEDVDHIIYHNVDNDLFKQEGLNYNVNKLEDLWNYLHSHKKDYFKDV